MKKIDCVESVGVPLSRRWLVSVRARALRCGVWFSVLTRTERACVDLVVKVVERVHSRVLRRILFSVVGKLVAALESPVERSMREVGVGLALKLSQIALKWGNRSAVSWADDVGFKRFLAVNYLNASV